MTKFFFIICSIFLPIVFSAQTYDIYAIKFGERKNYVRISDVAIGYNSGDSTKVFFMYWVLKNKDKIILVDAGFTAGAGAGVDSNLITFTQPDKLLASIYVKPEDVTDIIITHPHWDHIGGIDLYPKAMVWMQEEDYIDFVQKRKDPESCGFNRTDIQKVLKRKANGSLTLIRMNGKRDQDILPGITVFIAGSKHTVGSQYVMAQNGKQTVILASDNCKYYCNITNMLSSPATSDQKAYIRNLRAMKQWVNGNTDFVIPGHDPLVFAKFRTVTKAVVEIKK